MIKELLETRIRYLFQLTDLFFFFGGLITYRAQNKVQSMSGQDDHLSHHNVLRGQASLFTVMFLSGMLVRSSYCHVISNILISQKKEITQLKFQWPAIFPVLVGSVSSLKCLDAPAVLVITMH